MKILAHKTCFNANTPTPIPPSGKSSPLPAQRSFSIPVGGQPHPSPSSSHLLPPSGGQIHPFQPCGHFPSLLAANLTPLHPAVIFSTPPAGCQLHPSPGWFKGKRVMKLETRDGRRETGDERWETRDERQETEGGRRKEGEIRQVVTKATPMQPLKMLGNSQHIFFASPNNESFKKNSTPSHAQFFAFASMTRWSFNAKRDASAKLYNSAILNRQCDNIKFCKIITLAVNRYCSLKSIVGHNGS